MKEMEGNLEGAYKKVRREVIATHDQLTMSVQKALTNYIFPSIKKYICIKNRKLKIEISPFFILNLLG